MDVSTNVSKGGKRLFRIRAIAATSDDDDEEKEEDSLVGGGIARQRSEKQRQDWGV